MDLYYIFTVGFSSIFFLAIIYYSYINIRAYVEKQKELNRLDDRYDDLKRHRQNLIVGLPLLSTITIGHWKVEKSPQPNKSKTS